MLDARHGRQLVEGTVIAPIEHFGAANVLLDLPAIAKHPFAQRLRHVHALAVFDGARVG